MQVKQGRMISAKGGLVPMPSCCVGASNSWKVSVRGAGRFRVCNEG